MRPNVSQQNKKKKNYFGQNSNQEGKRQGISPKPLMHML